MLKESKGNTVSVSSSNNIPMYVFNGIEEECTKCGLEYKELEYVFEENFKLPTKAELAKDPYLK